jgi:hypothetical protein
MVILPICVKKLYYLGNYCVVVVKYHCNGLTNVIKYNLTLKGSELLRYFNPG